MHCAAVGATGSVEFPVLFFVRRIMANGPECYLPAFWSRHIQLKKAIFNAAYIIAGAAVMGLWVYFFPTYISPL